MGGCIPNKPLALLSVFSLRKTSTGPVTDLNLNSGDEVKQKALGSLGAEAEAGEEC